MLRESKARRGIQLLVIRLALGSGLSRRRGQGERHRLEGRRVGGAVWLAVQLTFFLLCLMAYCYMILRSIFSRYDVRWPVVY